MKKKCLLMLLLCFLLSVCIVANAGAADSSQSTGDAENLTEAERYWIERERQKRLERLLEEAKQDRLDKLRREYKPKPKNYFKNTVCSFGPQFRGISRRMTDEWYMFTPIDLSEDGKQTFDLIASHMFVIGEVTVTVENGRFQVDYDYNSSQIEIGREYFQIFPDFDSIEPDDLENFHLNKRFSYGRSYSIADKLAGDTDVILFVCNTATYEETTPGIIRYYSNNPDRIEMREAMLDRIGKTLLEDK